LKAIGVPRGIWWGVEVLGGGRENFALCDSIFHKSLLQDLGNFRARPTLTALISMQYKFEVAKNKNDKTTNKLITSMLIA
jgi:hypothetical protein